MTLQLWGMMQKAQDDPETIEQAIARMIAEHEADPEAHLGEGESLSEHKHETVIDHPPASVLPDKASDNDFTYAFTFESLDAFTKSPQTTAVNLKARFQVTNGVNNFSNLEINQFESQQWGNYPASLLFDIAVRFDAANAATARAEFHHIFFEIENNRVRGASWLNADEEVFYTDWYSVDVTQLTRLRAYYSVTEGKVRFYVDGDLIGETTDAWVPNSEEIFTFIVLNRNSASSAVFYATAMKTSIFEFQY